MKNEDKPMEVENISSDEHENINRDSIKNSIFDIAADMFALKDEDKERFEEMELEYDAKCDALDIVELVMEIEDEFGIAIDESESDKFVTFGDCIDFVWNKMSSYNDVISDREE